MSEAIADKVHWRLCSFWCPQRGHSLLVLAGVYLKGGHDSCWGAVICTILHPSTSATLASLHLSTLFSLRTTYLMCLPPEMLFQEMAAWFALWLHSAVLSCCLIKNLPLAPYWGKKKKCMFSSYTPLFCILFFQNTYLLLHIVLSGFYCLPLLTIL